MIFRNDACEINEAAILAVQPRTLMPRNLFYKDGKLHIGESVVHLSDLRKLIVIAAGKAAAAMAAEAETQLGDYITEGICITKYEHALPLKKFKTIEAAHPVPDENSILAGIEVLRIINNLTPKDIVLVLISGGASSLMADIPENCSLPDLQLTSEILVRSGATIHEINIVRKHLSKIKGGQLAKAAQPARVYTFLVSDVVGDDPGSIASGPCVPDHSSFSDAYKVLQEYNTWQLIPGTIRIHIEKGLKGELEETPKPHDLFFQNTYTKIIGNNRLSLLAAKEKSEQLGYRSIIEDGSITGNTESVSRKFVTTLIEYQGALPVCILAGGETTLQVTGHGKGGRNQHFVLCALDEMMKHYDQGADRNTTILSAGTDGTDGPTDAAGAITGTDMLRTGNINPETIQNHLAQFDSYTFFEKFDGLIKTGPTQTNVMDIIIGLINK